MNCPGCKTKECRSLNDCTVIGPAEQALIDSYHLDEVQKIVQAAAVLVDGGRAGSLSRLEEVTEFSLSMEYPKIGLAYCYGMERNAAEVAVYFRKRGLKVSAVSCTAGSTAQKDINEKSELPGVSCNPITQAEVLNREDIPFAITFGLCMGHDILFNRMYNGDVTTLLVKDRTCNHNPLEAIERLTSE
jgi:uncharacterized metal-binding protein